MRLLTHAALLALGLALGAGASRLVLAREVAAIRAAGDSLRERVAEAAKKPRPRLQTDWKDGQKVGERVLLPDGRVITVTPTPTANMEGKS